MKLIVGAGSGSGHVAVAEMLDAAGVRVESAGRDLSVLQTLMAEAPDAPVLLLCERPEYAVLEALAAGSDVEAAVDRWRQGSDALLRTLRLNRARAWMVDAHDALAFPNELARVWGERGGSRVTLSPSKETDPPDAVHAAIAAQWVSAHRDLQDVAGELEASSIPLREGGTRFDADVAAATRSLAQLRAELDRGKSRLDEESKAHRSERLAREAAEAEASALRKEAEKAKGDLAEAGEENELLLAQLHQVQEELETHYLKGKELEEQLAKARQDAEAAIKTKQAAEARVKALNEKAAAAEKAKATIENEKKTLQNELDAARKKVADVPPPDPTKVKDLEEENELLLLQLHQVQEELESYYLEANSFREKIGVAGSKEMGQVAKYTVLLEKSIAKLLGSTTWKVMAPVRVMGRILKRVFLGKKSSRTALPKRPPYMERFGPRASSGRRPRRGRKR